MLATREGSNQRRLADKEMFKLRLEREMDLSR